MDLTTTLLALPALLTVLVPLANFLFHLLLGFLPKDKQAAIDEAVQRAVTAAEQVYVAVPGAGQQKLDLATTMVNVGLKRIGVKQDPQLIRRDIESLVHELGLDHSAQPAATPMGFSTPEPGGNL